MKKKIPIYGNGKNIRDWIHVDDNVDAILTVLKKGKINQNYNIGSNNEISNIQIVETICAILDNEIPLDTGKLYKEGIVFVEDRPGHDFRYAIDATKIEKELGWKPKESFQTGIKKTVLWFLENRDWWREIKKFKYKQERLGILKQ